MGVIFANQSAVLARFLVQLEEESICIINLAGESIGGEALDGRLQFEITSD